MTNLLGKAAAWLEAQRQRHLTTGVGYERAGRQISLRATIGVTVFRTQDEYGRTLRTQSRDYLIRAADLVFDGIGVLPRRGDVIHEGGHLYEVMAPAGEPEWRWSDPGRQTLRVHTKEIGTE